MVMPSVANSFMTCSTSPTSSGSSAEVGSSNNITCGCMASARAMATRCFWPPDRLPGIAWAFCRRPTLSSRSIASAFACCLDKPRTLRGPMVMLSIADRCGNRLNDWNTMPTSSRKRLSARSPSMWPASVNTRPQISTLPLSAGSSPLQQRKKVLLPEPLGPIITTTSDGCTSRSIPCSTRCSPNDLRKPRMLTIGSCVFIEPYPLHEDVAQYGAVGGLSARSTQNR